MKKRIESFLSSTTVKVKKGEISTAVQGRLLGKFPCCELSKDEVRVLSGFVLTIDIMNFTHQYNHRRQFVCVTFAHPFSGIMSSCWISLHYNFCYHCLLKAN